MDVRHRCCAGLDVHERTVVATVRRVDPAGKVEVRTQTFAPMTRDLLALADWLAAQGVTIAAMESTGSYWKPVFNLLEGRVQVVLVNAHHVKQVPGRKTDVKDSQWIAELLQHGLLRPSFIPPRPTHEPRDLTRQRAHWSARRRPSPTGSRRSSKMPTSSSARSPRTHWASRAGI